MDRDRSLNNIEKDLILEAMINKYKIKVVKRRLWEEYKKGIKRQKPGAKRDSGFMSGISRAIKILEDIESIHQIDMVHKILEDTEN